MKRKLTFKIWFLFICLALSLISIFITPNFLQAGVLIRSIDSNSTAFEQGLRQGQIIISVDGMKVENVNDFSQIIQEKFPAEEEIKTIIQTKDSEYIIFSKTAPEIIVVDIEKTNLRLGLDLAGGSRALVQAEERELTSQEVNDLVEITRVRFNEFGLTDIKVSAISDLSGNNFMSVEVAGATPQDLERLISEQGKFEAKIGNDTVFIGGERDITSVPRSGQDAGGVYQCDQTSQGTWFCNFRFTIYLSPTAAERQAALTANLSVNSTPQGNYLSQNLDLYLDDKLVDSLRISENLKGRVTTQISIQGSGVGETRLDAIKDAENSMKHLQTILITGSLPFKLEIIKLDTISPTLGAEFLRAIFFAMSAAILMVSLIIFLRYRKVKSSLVVLFTSISEIIIILGVASFIGWDLDLPSIAGILAAIGTGIDSQVIILDEAKEGKSLNIKQRMKRAFAIILGAYFTSLAALFPLLWAAAGLFKGFAITTIIGITTGVLITRPAFTDIVKKIEE